MIETSARPFVPPAPVPPRKALSSWQTIRGMRSNILQTWPQVAYEEMVVRRRVFGVEQVILNDARAVRHVLMSNLAAYERPIFVRRQLRPGLGDGVVLSEGEQWRRKRRTLAPSFTPQRVGQLLPHFIAAAETLVRKCEAGSVNFAARFQETALDALCRSLFSMPLGSPGTTDLPDLVREFLVTVGRPSLWDMLARREGDFPWFSGGRVDISRRWFAQIDTLMAARMALPRDGSADAARDILDLLLAARDPNGGAGLSPVEIRDEVGTIMGAGFETAARSMFWTLYLLANDPAAQEAIAAELAAFPPAQLSKLADHRAWPALRRALLEAMRLYPPAPYVLRVAIQPDRIGDIEIAAGTQVMISPWIIHRHHRLWESPEAFLPSRFAGREDQPGENWLPFGAGPRICLGATFAIAESMTILAVLLSRFHVSLDDRRPVLPTVAAITTTPSIEPLFTLTPRHHPTQRATSAS
jgi:cytochrome P450